MAVSNPYINRKWVIGIIFAFVFLVFIIRLLSIQVFSSKYKLSAENNSQRHVTQYPARGLIYDRNGRLMVYNKPIYDLKAIPQSIKAFDTLLLCNLLKVPITHFRKQLKKAQHYSYYKPSVIVKQISWETYAHFQEYLFMFPGFFIQSRLARAYTEPVASHILGYVSEVGRHHLEADAYYQSGDYIGMNGLEQFYEKQLRGTKGNKIYLVDVHNSIQGQYKQGQYDTKAVAGHNIITSLDLDLQAYGEYLMKGKKGSIVAIEPSSGEILSLISAPSYKPNDLVGRERSHYYKKLQQDPMKPLFNRAKLAQYPPGSIFKIINALIALQKGTITKQTAFPCDKTLIGCHNHPDNSNVKKALQFSCNPYFYYLYKGIIQQHPDINRFKDSRSGLSEWKHYVNAFGLGHYPAVDIAGCHKGSIPDTNYYDKVYGKNAWAFSNIYSNAIGQGEIMVTPLQMANLAATIANKGHYILPHIAKEINGQAIQYDSLYRKETGIDSTWFTVVQEAMSDVVNAEKGTGGLARINDIEVCGKTGTVQNPHGEDHSVFIAFAPKDKPKIALAVYVENAGFGGVWAAPIASLMIEKYLKRHISDIQHYKEQRILNYQPFPINNEN